MILLTLFTPNSAQGYYDYFDCNTDCLLANYSCTIELASGDFISICYEHPTTCLQRASSEVACLRLDSPPIGGEKTWLKYKNRHPTPTPTPTPAPTTHEDCKVFKTAIYVLIALIILFANFEAFLIYRKYSRSDSTIVESLINNPENPYQPTTENID